MSTWDRRSTLSDYEAMFAAAENEEELMEQLGTPTKLAISLALNYVPSPPPEVPEIIEEAEEGSVEGSCEEPAADAPEAVEEAQVPAAAEAPGEEALPAPVEEAEEPVPAKKRKVRPFGLIVAILFGIVIGIPVALFLIILGIPFLVSGIGIIAAALIAAMNVIPMLTMISDILVIGGAGLAVCALGLLVAWFGLWLSFELGYLWISGVVFRAGRALTYKKEVAAQ